MMEEIDKVFIRNESSEEAHASLLGLIAKSFPEWRQQFQRSVDEAIEKILNCDPKVLLCMCAYRVVGYKLSVHPDSEECKWRAIEFIQNILVTHKSHPADLGSNEMMDQCANVVIEVEELYIGLCKGLIFATHLVPDRISDESGRHFLAQSLFMYLVRGKRDISFQGRYFSLLLLRQDGNFKKNFGVAAQDVVEGIEKLCKSLYFSKSQTYLSNVKALKKVLRSKRCSRKMRETVLAEAYDKAKRDALEDTAYDVEAITGWPKSFVSEFSLPLPRADIPIEHEYQFWPIDDLLIKDRPFIEIDGRHFCFDYYIFADNFYHALFKACIAKEQKEHGHDWSDAQTAAIESGVANIFSKLLPGTKIYNNLKYKCGREKTETRELDVVVICPGMLIVVETKGMEYIHESPIIHPERVLEFYRRSVNRAGAQTRRFLDYLGSIHGNVELKDIDGNTVVSAPKESFGRFCRICVLSDSTNEVLSCTNKLEVIKADAKGLICLALDDLLVYEKYFESRPMEFLAYLSRRLDASFVEKIIASDELDHLGLYISNTNYVDEVQKYDDRVDFMSIDDNRRAIDDFFLSLRYPEVVAPRPYVPELLQKLLNQIWKSSTKDKLKVAMFIMDLSKTEKDWLANAIGAELKNQQLSGVSNLRGMSAAQSKGGVGISLLVSTQWARPMPHDIWFARIQGLMTKFHESKRIVYALIYDPNGDLLDCSLEYISEDKFDPNLSVEADTFVREVDRRVVAKAVRKGQVGRNCPCPCGSGRKFKQCCGRR